MLEKHKGKYDDKILIIIKSMLQYNQKDRPSPSDLLKLIIPTQPNILDEKQSHLDKTLSNFCQQNQNSRIQNLEDIISYHS